MSTTLSAPGRAQHPEIIDQWKNRLSVVDVWADSHREVLVSYHVMH